MFQLLMSTIEMPTCLLSNLVRGIPNAGNDNVTFLVLALPFHNLVIDCFPILGAHIFQETPDLQLLLELAFAILMLVLHWVSVEVQ